MSRHSLLYSVIVMLLVFTLLPLQAQQDSNTNNDTPEQVEISNINSNAEPFLGQTVRIDAKLVEVVGDHAFFIQDDGLIPDQLLVIYEEDTISGFEIPVLAEEDIRVSVLAEVAPFETSVLEEHSPDLSLNDAVFENYEDEAILIASVVSVVSHVDAELHDLPDIPLIREETDYYTDRNVILQADLVESISPHAILIQQDDMLETHTMLVLYTNEDIDSIPAANLAAEDVHIRIHGTVYVFERGRFSQMMGLDFSEEEFNDYADDLVVVADEIHVIEDINWEELQQLSVDRVTDDIVSYLGVEITIQDSLVESISDRMFLMEDNDFMNPERIMVFDNREDGSDDMDFAQLAASESDVHVEGTLYTFDRAEFERAFDMTFAEETYGDYEGTPVLVAHSIATVGEDE
mgnify:CR=1 FL=1